VVLVLEAAFDDGGDVVFLFGLADLVVVVVAVVVVTVECLDFDDDDKCLDFVSFITGSVLSWVLRMGEMLCFSIDDDDFEFADLFDLDFFAAVVVAVAVAVASPLVVLSYKDSLPPLPNVLDMAARSKFTL